MEGIEIFKSVGDYIVKVDNLIASTHGLSVKSHVEYAHDLWGASRLPMQGVMFTNLSEVPYSDKQMDYYARLLKWQNGATEELEEPSYELLGLDPPNAVIAEFKARRRKTTGSG